MTSDFASQSKTWPWKIKLWIDSGHLCNHKSITKDTNWRKFLKCLENIPRMLELVCLKRRQVFWGWLTVFLLLWEIISNVSFYSFYSCFVLAWVCLIQKCMCACVRFIPLYKLYIFMNTYRKMTYKTLLTWVYENLQM